MKLRFLVEGKLIEKNVNLDDVAGRECVSRRTMTNGSFSAPAGTRFRIRRAKPGFSLELVTPCSKCGLHGAISRVPYLDVVIDGPPPVKGQTGPVL